MKLPRSYSRQLFFRSSLFRQAAQFLIDNKPPRIDLSHFQSYRADQIGPLQRDEALFLYGLTRALDPRTIVEFGFLNGHSAFNFLQAAGPQCMVFSYDISEKSEQIAKECLSHFKNFHFIRKSQVDFEPADIANRKIDLCFIDASHDLALNLKTFALIRPELLESAIIAIHDTGVWERRLFNEDHRRWAASDAGLELGKWLGSEGFQPAVDERRFVNVLLQDYPEFSQIHFHSKNTLRHGITLLQKRVPLVTDSTSM